MRLKIRNGQRVLYYYEEKFEDTKGVIRSRKSKHRQYSGQKTEVQTIQWSKDRRTDNTVAKRQKYRQYSGQKTEVQTIQWQKAKN